MSLSKYYDEDVVKELESRGYTVHKNDSRNFQTGTLSQLLADRYNVSYHVPKEKLIDLVTQELSI